MLNAMVGHTLTLGTDQSISVCVCGHRHSPAVNVCPENTA
jgi:hypothetical protein